jgi:hypothetical protein
MLMTWENALCRSHVSVPRLRIPAPDWFTPEAED